MVRTSKFGRGFDTGGRASRERRRVIFRPERGFDGVQPPSKVEEGFSPSMRNFVVDGGGIRPRSGLSQFGDLTLNNDIVGGIEGIDPNANFLDLAISTNSAAWFQQATDQWSTLSYVPSDNTADFPSASSREYYESATMYDPTDDTRFAVWTNDTDFPYFATLNPSLTTYSDFSYARSLLSQARTVTAADQRLVWGNVEEDGNNRQTRVVWSTRGNPKDYTLPPDGDAGFQDLVGITGDLLTIESLGENLFIFSDKEIWRGRATDDVFAFDFGPLETDTAVLDEKTVTRTPVGVFFVGQDYDGYILTAQGVQSIGAGPTGESRIRGHLEDVVAASDRLWAAYNPRRRRIELYFPDSDSSSGYPNRALFYHLETQAWTEQRFPYDLSFGFTFSDPGADAGTNSTWDGTTTTWDQLSSQWDNFGQVARGLFRPLTFSSDQTAVRLQGTQFSDDGNDIDCRWRSHALKDTDQSDARYERLDEVWIEYEADTASNVSVFTTGDGGDNFDSGVSLAMGQSNRSNVFAPVDESGPYPQFEVRTLGDQRPKLARFEVRIEDQGRFWGGR